MGKILTLEQVKTGFLRSKAFMDKFILTTTAALEEMEGEITALEAQVLSESEYQELLRKLG